MLARINASLSSLSPAEQRVGSLCLQNPRDFARMPVSELAQRAHVSKPTVVRFCRSVGYEGLADFKRVMAGKVEEGVPFIHPCVGALDNSREAAIKVIDCTLAALQQYRHAIPGAALERVVDVLAQADRDQRKILFFGVGDSGLVALDAQHKFFRLNMHASAYSDGHTQLMSATVLRPGDCVVLISSSGRTRDLMDSCDLARKNGATTIAITANCSPLAAAADVHLCADHGESYDRDIPMVSRLLHLTIVDILATCVALRIGGDKLTPLLRDMKYNLRSKRFA